jgi:hypothetical protein
MNSLISTPVNRVIKPLIQGKTANLPIGTKYALQYGVFKLTCKSNKEES